MKNFRAGDKLIRIKDSWNDVHPGMTVEVYSNDYGDLYLVGHEGRFSSSKFVRATLENYEQQIKLEIGLIKKHESDSFTF